MSDLATGSRGWVRLWRKFWDSPDLKPEPFTEREAFLWSVTQAAHTPHLQWFNGSQFPVDRGEFVTSLHSMMAAFQWSEKRVRGFGERMVKARKWAKRGAYQGAKAPTLLTVCNYGLFQSPQQIEGEAKGEAEDERGAKQGRSKGEARAKNRRMAIILRMPKKRKR